VRSGFHDVPSEAAQNEWFLQVAAATATLMWINSVSERFVHINQSCALCRGRSGEMTVQGAAFEKMGGRADRLERQGNAGLLPGAPARKLWVYYL
jgi:hypothetical protein